MLAFIFGNNCGWSYSGEISTEFASILISKNNKWHHMKSSSTLYHHIVLINRIWYESSECVWRGQDEKSFLKHQILLLSLTTFNVFFYAILCQFPFVCAYLIIIVIVCIILCHQSYTKKMLNSLKSHSGKKKVLFLLQANKIPKFVSCQTRLISSHDLMTLNLKRCELRILILSA